MKKLLQMAWLSRGWLACLLWPAAQLYRLIVHARLSLYRNGFFESHRFRVPVIVVGNLVAGGAGKTPLVIALARHFQARGLAVGIVSRGYGRSGRESLEVLPETAIDQSGDEPALIKRATGAPVFVAQKRADAVRSLLEAYPGSAIVVCDDGLQHYALQRDIEIAVFDDRGVGNGWLLPAGPLREPWPGHRRGGTALVVHTGQKPAFAGFASRRELADHAISPDGSQIALNTLLGHPLTAIAGIASPEAFFDMLRSRGLVLEKTLALPDHHAFENFDFAALKGRTVLCTEKDAVKLFAGTGRDGLNLLAVPLDFSPEPAFFGALDTKLGSLLSQLPSNHGHQTS